MAERAITMTPPVARLSLRDNWWVVSFSAALITILITAVQSHDISLLLYVHLFSAILWTGTDLFMGFILGPILRKVDLATRRAIITQLFPRLLFYMTPVSAITVTAGYYLAQWRGFFSLPYPTAYWVVAAGIMAGIMTVQGLGIILPTNLRVFFEIRKEQPDGEKLRRLAGFYVKVVAIQGVLQLAMVIIMVKFRMGL